jgi:hypothetical protein
MRGPVNHVAVVNRSAFSDDELAVIVETYRTWMKSACQAWALPVPGLAVYGRQHDQAIDEEAAIILTDSGNEPDAFGWHQALGLARFGYVDLGMCRQYGEPVSRVFGHELLELGIDPDCDAWAGPYPDGTHVAVEVSDPVQRYSIKVEGSYLGHKAPVELADYVLPSWFDPGAAAGPYSQLNVAPAPLRNAAGGYHLEESAGGVVSSEGSIRLKSFGRTLRRVVSQRDTRLRWGPQALRSRF